MRTWMLAAVALLCVFTLVPPAAMAGKAAAQDRISSAAKVFDEIMNTPDKGIPSELLENAECVIIVPSMMQGGFIVGAKYGKGVATCRQGSRWSAPSMVRAEGGSVGFQIGGEAVDLVMLVMNKNGEDFLYRDKFTLGADASAAAGPVGRHVSAETNARMNAQILTWSRSKGLFGGIALEGASLRPDKSANEELYGRNISARQILTGSTPTPAAAQALLATITRHWQEAVAEKGHPPGKGVAEPRGLGNPNKPPDKP